jgi:hypothetical protein
MIAYLTAKMLPGLITGAVMAVFGWLSHRKTRRHITATTNAQTAALKETAAPEEPERS